MYMAYKNQLDQHNGEIVTSALCKKLQLDDALKGKKERNSKYDGAVGINCGHEIATLVECHPSNF